MDTQQQLDAILSESVDHARQRRQQEFVWFNKDGLALYGAGTLGRSILKKLRQVGIEPIAFADDTPEKQGHTLDGVEIMPPAEVVHRFGADTLFIVTILNPQLSFLKAKKKLHPWRAASFLSVAWRFHEVFLPYYQFETPEAVLTKSAEIKRGFALLSDEESRRQYIAHLRFRLYLEYESLPGNGHEGYFPRDIFPSLPPQTVFVDCGAFDGDTIREFLDRQGNDFARIYAFEPDADNFARLQRFVTELADDRIELFRMAVGQRWERLAFNATGNMSANISSDGPQSVPVMPLDDVVNPDGASLFLKFDVEGSEYEALNGAQNLLRTAKPLVALSVYHRPDDLWALPLHLHSFDPNYKYYLRTQGEDGMDVICYAVPLEEAGETPALRQKSLRV